MNSPDARSRQTLRIIDANLNRVGEGLRLLEDIARLVLNDVALSQQLKTMRHELITGDPVLQKRLLDSRDSEGDVGISLAGEERERELPLVLVANSRRVQESLRVLEELAKVPGIIPGLDSEKFKQARFSIYTLEQRLLSRLLRKDKLERLSGLYVIIDIQVLKGRNYLEVARQAIQGGAGVIQLRDKVSRKADLLPVARELKTVCTKNNVLFIMNDYLDLALETDADGLHVGQDDLPVSVARRLLPLDKILGCSTTTVEQALEAQADGADYVAIGSIFPTSTKEVVTVVGVERLRQVRQVVSVPLVAIGGITRDNVREVIAAGADSAAVITAVLWADSPQAAAQQITRVFKEKK
jgi:thiamine-phosphate pyrophosphorylase